MEAGKFTETGDAVDGLGLGSAKTADHQRGLSVSNGDIGDELTIGQDGDVVYGAAGERLDLQIQVHGDLSRLLHYRGGLQGDPEVLILNLRNGLVVGGSEILIEQAGRH